jgi:hypothetical protein
MHVLWIGCRKANSHFGKPTAVISNNWSKSTAVAFCISEAFVKSFSTAATKVTVYILSKSVISLNPCPINPEFPS